jgi:VWFA-related protein
MGTRIGLLTVLLVATTASQQEPGFTTRVNVVPVPALVRDNEGKSVYGLHAEDFVIEDDGVEQSVRLDESVEVAPMSMVIAVQCGRRAGREFGRIEGLASMLDPILSHSENEAAIVFFDSTLQLARDFTNDAESIEAELKNLQSGDHGAAIIDAVAYSARLLARRPEGRQRVLLLISETRDHGSWSSKLDNVVRLINETNVSVYALPFSPYASHQLDDLRASNKDEWAPNIDILEKLGDIHQAMRKNSPGALAAMTGGEYSRFATRDAFETNMVNFANHLHSRYLLSFEPKDPHPGLHQIRVRLRKQVSNYTLLYRRSYWVPGGSHISGGCALCMR